MSLATVSCMVCRSTQRRMPGVAFACIACGNTNPPPPSPMPEGTAEALAELAGMVRVVFPGGLGRSEGLMRDMDGSVHVVLTPAHAIALAAHARLGHAYAHSREAQAALAADDARTVLVVCDHCGLRGRTHPDRSWACARCGTHTSPPPIRCRFAADPARFPGHTCRDRDGNDIAVNGPRDCWFEAQTSLHETEDHLT